MNVRRVADHWLRDPWTPAQYTVCLVLLFALLGAIPSGLWAMLALPFSISDRIAKLAGFSAYFVFIIAALAIDAIALLSPLVFIVLVSIKRTRRLAIPFLCGIVTLALSVIMS